MNHRITVLTSNCALLLAFAVGCANDVSLQQREVASNSSRPTYPSAKKSDVVDTYHGTAVADPYRWLEDAESPETQAFVDAQNKLAREFLDGPTREVIKERLTDLINYRRFSPPKHEGDRFFFTENEGLQNQSVLFVAKTADGQDSRVLIDPNTFSEDGTTALSGTEYTRDGSLLAYGVSSGGSDQKEVRVREIETGNDRPDVIKFAKFASIAWKQDNSGFWYNRYPTPGTVAKEDGARFNKLYWHQLGTDQVQDKMLLDPGDKELSVAAQVSEDGEILLLYLSRGSTRKNRLYLRPANEPLATTDGDFTKLFDKEDAQYSFIAHDGPVYYILTNLDAPRRKIVAVNTDHPERANWKTLVPEGPDTISEVGCVNDQFIVQYMHDAHDVLKLFAMDGKLVREIDLPGIGSVSGVTGKRNDSEMFFTFSSFIIPPTIYRYNFASAELEAFRKPEVKFDPERYETKQVFATSKDGTKVPMFITHRKDVSLDGNNPTILNAYGGFNVSTTPGFSALRVAWLEQGGVFCQANLRGGGEYGEEWHRAGMLERKQNVFDDFRACAQWLIDQKYTQPKRLAIQGGSNGGLLVSAVEVQWPEQFGAVLCQVPLTDMLRYHRFTVGRFWVPEYGNADADAKQFATLRAYSPLQNVRHGTKYPPTLIFTADGDDRVAPLHARKFTAALQAADGGYNPILLRSDTRAGHGGGRPITKIIDSDADEYAFLAKIFGMDWK
ncbi:prolyl oligopeptidase family serine peptidase [soil metagenome]